MKKTLLGVWLLVPVGAAAYHMGPGQDHLRLDDAARLIAQAGRHAQRAAERAETEGDLAAVGDWALAETAYEEALGLLPPERVHDRRAVRLERAKCQMFVSELPEANSELRELVDEMVADELADAELRNEARRTLANSEYYMTWLMRLEGAGREDWEPRIEAARQIFKLLSEEAGASGDESATARDREDLEAAIRLARMDLTELQGLPLPSQ